MQLFNAPNFLLGAPLSCLIFPFYPSSSSSSLPPLPSIMPATPSAWPPPPPPTLTTSFRLVEPPPLSPRLMHVPPNHDPSIAPPPSPPQICAQWYRLHLKARGSPSHFLFRRHFSQWHKQTPFPCPQTLPLTPPLSVTALWCHQNKRHIKYTFNSQIPLLLVHHVPINFKLCMTSPSLVTD